MLELKRRVAVVVVTTRTKRARKALADAATRASRVTSTKTCAVGFEWIAPTTFHASPTAKSAASATPSLRANPPPERTAARRMASAHSGSSA